jgi:hypothetical protein
MNCDLKNCVLFDSVSRSLMRMIERRQFFDKLVVYGGMLLTTVLVFAMWYYLY